MAKFACILPAAGKSSRFKDKNYKKPFAPLANRAVWLHSAERFLHRDDVTDALVLQRAEFGVAHFPGGMPAEGLSQRCRAQQAADVVGTERRLAQWLILDAHAKRLSGGILYSNR